MKATAPINLIITLFVLISFSCKHKQQSVPDTSAAEIMTTDSSAIVSQPDSLKLDPETEATALQQDPPPTHAQTAPGKSCDPNFTLIAKPTGSQQIFFVSGFDAREFKCWNAMEEHGQRICAERACIVYYVDKADIKTNSTPPHYLDPHVLAQHGIGRFEHNGKTWEIKGARIWERNDKSYGYYNSNHHIGG